MEFKRPADKDPTTKEDLTNVTILSTPRPQASSTVDRKTSYGSWIFNGSVQDENKCKRPLLNDSDVVQKTEDSSLGILNNISCLLSDRGVMEGKQSLNDVNTIDNERELARKLLQRCSEPRKSPSYIEPDKENNVNLQNLMSDSTPSTLVDPTQSLLSQTGQGNLQQTPARRSATSATNATTNVIFEPNEISARSSALSKSLDKSSWSTSLPKNAGISFDAATAELMAQFGDEEFQSGSRAGSRMLADELSWQQNCSYAMPTNLSNISNGSGKEHLELSCFSGIIGDVDLSVESYAGRKVSVGEFFRRKCGNMGEIQDVDPIERPSFGFAITSPTRRDKIMPLVDESSIITEASMTRELDNQHFLETTDSSKQHDVMSLSSIALALTDLQNGTPRRLVDVIMAKKRKMMPQAQLIDTSGDTYVLSAPSRSSVASKPSLNPSEKPEKDTSVRAPAAFLRHPARFSLDSKVIHDTPDSRIKSNRMSLNSAFDDAANGQMHSSYTDFLEEQLNKRREDKEKFASKKSIGTAKETSLHRLDATRNLLSAMEDSEISYSPSVEFPIPKQVHDISYQVSDTNAKSMKDSNILPQTILNSKSLSQLDSLLLQSPESYLKDFSHKEDVIISHGSSLNAKSIEEIQNNLLEDVKMMEMEKSTVHHSTKLESGGKVELPDYRKKTGSNVLENVISARNTQELFICIVGVSREVEVEILNKGERWMMCSLTLHHIRGEKDSITLDLPEDKMLVEPDAWKSVKVGVKISQMGKPIIAVLNIAMADMVTRSNGIITHFMCFIPEEPQVSVLTHSGREEIYFQKIAEKCCKTLPVTLENKNNVELPVKLSINEEHEGPKLFSIDKLTDETMNTSDTNNGTRYLVLKPRQQFTVNIQFKGALLTSLNVGKGLFHATAKLIIQLHTDEDDGPIVKEVPLIGYVGSSKIDSLDTQFPVVIPRKQSKPITLINAGDVAVLLSASIVENEESMKSVQDFSVRPDNLFLQTGERGAILISYKPQKADSPERRVIVKVTAGGNNFYYPVVGEGAQSSDQLTLNVQRCETPQYTTHTSSSPSSPHSTASNRSGNSGRNSPVSSASGSTVAGDVIPIQSTHAALVWSSVRAGKSDTKEFTIRNKSEHKIKLQAHIVDNNRSFKFLKERQTVGLNMVLILQRMESKTLSVIFGPNQPGASAGKIVFTHYNPRNEQEKPKKIIFLYGYGGTGKVEITEAFKDIGGQMWLSLGQMNSGGTLNARIKLQNTGDLCSYAKIRLTPKALYPAMVSSWHVDPTELLLGPNEVQWVKLEFRPRREDLALLHRADVSHVGTLTITHGDEPTRWRIRRLYSKLKETGQLNGGENETFRNIVYPICKVFPGEALVSDLSIIHDSVQNLGDLCRGVNQHEVMLTMEVNADETLTTFTDNVDDTQMFYSLCSDSSSMFATGCESFMPSETLTERTDQGLLYGGDITVRPSTVTLAPPFRTEATVTVSSLCNVAQPFETVLSCSEWLSVVPTEGMIPAGRSFSLRVQCKKEINQNLEAVLQVFMENEKREVLIKVSCNNIK